MTVKDVTVSTNDDIRALAREGAEEWTSVIAKKQTGGRGQVGRKFYSPEGGLYMSVLLRPRLQADRLCLITTAAAVACARAVEKLCGIELKVKWVNDLYLDDRKVCGILTEAVLRGDGSAEYAVLGIGLNITKPEEGFPPEISESAAALSETGAVLCKPEVLAEEIINEFRTLYDALPSAAYREEYMRRMKGLGENVTVSAEDGDYFTARITGVDEDFRLILSKDGKTFTVGEKYRINY